MNRTLKYFGITTALFTTLFYSGKNLHAEARVKTRRLKFLDEQLKPPNKNDFDKFFSGIDELYVIAVSGPTSSGKSTLLNELYKNTLGEETFNAEGGTLRNVTVGCDAILTDIHPEVESTEPGTSYREKTVATLLLDTEGLLGPEPNSTFKSDLMLLRLLPTANVIIYNCQGAPTKEVFTSLSQFSKLVDMNFEELSTEHRPDIVFFAQQCNRLFNRHTLQTFGPDGSLPKYLFHDYYAACSPSMVKDSLRTSPDKNLDASDLLKVLNNIKEYNQNAFRRTSDNLWHWLNFFDKEAPCSLIRDHPDYRFPPCEAVCELCDKQCAKTKIRVHSKHRVFDDGRGCSNRLVEQWRPKCRLCYEQCSASLASLPDVERVKTLWYPLYGHCYNCKVHSTIAHDYELARVLLFLFVILQSSEKKENISNYYDHRWK
ncbi:hypothetical protein AKO1_013583 [Acrasis kona]|uniref:PF14 n=1 Tax=Acrasis kona TaxID=1008807 RepID=A0AAW2YSK7_9EUKA